MKTPTLFAMAFLFLLSSCKEPQPTQQFVSTDIDNFWKAYDQIQSTEDTTLQKKYLNDLFIEEGTPGMKSLMKVRRYSAKEYLKAIEKYPKFWNSIRSNTNKADKHYADIDRDIAKLKKLYPELKPATIYFSMGLFRTNGTIEEDRVLIGSEMALSSKSVETSELPEHVQLFNQLYNPIDDISFLCTHEYLHTQQKELVHNLLSYCIYEGIPEFLTVLATGKKSYLSGIEFGETNHEKVRDKFEEEVYIPSRTYHWLWSSNTIFGERDLGYAVGYGMAKRYYQQAADKKQAIKEMIELDFSNEDAVERFVDQSKYLNKPLETLYTDFEQLRPTVTHIRGVENGSKKVNPGITPINIYFSEALNGSNTSIDFGSEGKTVFPKLVGDRIWSADNKSWQITAELEANKHYQILISNNFRLENGIPLKPFLIEFWTGE